MSGEWPAPTPHSPEGERRSKTMPRTAPPLEPPEPYPISGQHPPKALWSPGGRSFSHFQSALSEWMKRKYDVHFTGEEPEAWRVFNGHRVQGPIRWPGEGLARMYIQIVD